jgi:GGDEF domain-containing protein
VSLHQWLNHIHTQLTTPITYHGDVLTVGATIGATRANPTQPVGAWLHHADLAMYQARAQDKSFSIYTHISGNTTGPRPTSRIRDQAESDLPASSSKPSLRVRLHEDNLCHQGTPRR